MTDVGLEERSFMFMVTVNARTVKIIANHVVKDSKSNLVRIIIMRRNNANTTNTRMEEVAILPQRQGDSPLDQDLQMFNDKSRLGTAVRCGKRTASIYMDRRRR